jgi:hypothetical protein
LASREAGAAGLPGAMDDSGRDGGMARVRLTGEGECPFEVSALVSHSAKIYLRQFDFFFGAAEHGHQDHQERDDADRI